MFATNTPSIMLLTLTGSLRGVVGFLHRNPRDLSGGGVFATHTRQCPSTCSLSVLGMASWTPAGNQSGPSLVFTTEQER